MLYIVHIRVDEAIVDDWIDWMTEVHIPDVMETGCFASAAMARDAGADTDSRRAYRIVYRAPSEEAYEEYVEEYAEKLQEEHTERYEGQFEASRDLLPVVGCW